MKHEEAEKPLAISIEECAKRLNISRNLAYEMCRQGIIKTVQLGRRKIVPLKALEKLLSTHQQENKKDDMD